MINTCPVCEEGKLTPGSRIEKSEYKGTKYSVEYEFSECEECGADVVLPDQAKANKVRIQDEHKKILGLLTSIEIKQFRDKLGLTQAIAADLLGGGPNSFSKYERGEVVQSGPMDRLIRLVSTSSSAFNELQRVAGISLIEENKTFILDYDKPARAVGIGYVFCPKTKYVRVVKHSKAEGNLNLGSWVNIPPIRKEVVNG